MIFPISKYWSFEVNTRHAHATLGSGTAGCCPETPVFYPCVCQNVKGHLPLHTRIHEELAVHVLNRPICRNVLTLFLIFVRFDRWDFLCGFFTRIILRIFITTLLTYQMWPKKFSTFISSWPYCWGRFLQEVLEAGLWKAPCLKIVVTCVRNSNAVLGIPIWNLPQTFNRFKAYFLKIFCGDTLYGDTTCISECTYSRLPKIWGRKVSWLCV